MPPARSERARRLPPEERRAAIVDATLPLVLRHGAAVSTRQIAEAAGIAEGTIFRAFTEKDALIRAVVAKALDPAPALAELGRIDRALPLRDRLAAGATILHDRISSVANLLGVLGMREPPRGPEHADDPHAHHGRAGDDALRDALADLVGSDHGQLRIPPAELAHLLGVFVFVGSHPRLNAGTAYTPRRVVELLLDGVLVPDPAAPPDRLERRPHHTEDVPC